MKISKNDKYCENNKENENNKYNENIKLKEECPKSIYVHGFVIFVQACIIFATFVKFWCKLIIFIVFCFVDFRS